MCPPICCGFYYVDKNVAGSKSDLEVGVFKQVRNFSDKRSVIRERDPVLLLLLRHVVWLFLLYLMCYLIPQFVDGS
jgi:hypothetical protein